MYTMQEATETVIKIAEDAEEMRVTFFPRKGLYKIQLLEGGHFTDGWECFNHLKALYEATDNQKIDWNYFLYTVYDKHIEIKNTYKFI